MKALYEVTNDYMGNSYIRCYVWADGEEAARDLATERLKYDAEYRGLSPKYFEHLTVELLFREDAEPFSTFPSDDGFEMTDWRSGPARISTLLRHGG